MKNKEYYQEQIMTWALQGEAVGFDLRKQAIIPCRTLDCVNCKFYRENCNQCYLLREAWANSEYIPPHIDWNAVPEDTPVLVAFNGVIPNTPRHFSQYDDIGKHVFTFSDGKSSFTASLGDDEIWDLQHVRLAKEEDIKKYTR